MQTFSGFRVKATTSATATATTYSSIFHFHSYFFLPPESLSLFVATLSICSHTNTVIIQMCNLHKKSQTYTHLHILLHTVKISSRYVCSCFLVVAQFSAGDFCSLVLAFLSELYRRILFEDGWHLFESK